MIQVAIAVDQVLNTVVWLPGDGFGFADETLSARAWRLRTQSNAWRVIDALFFWQKLHCQHAYESERLRRHLPQEYRP